MPADFFEFGDRNGRGDVVGKHQIEFGFDKLPRFHRLKRISVWIPSSPKTRATSLSAVYVHPFS